MIALGLHVESQSQSTPIPAQKILDVGCGQNKYPGAIGIDSNPRADADVIHDLGVLPYPFADSEFDRIICRHVIEHVPDVMSFVSELHRITKPGGVIKIVTPHYSNPDWPTDPTHRTYVSLANLWRLLGLEWLTNLDQHWPALRFTRKFWEFYLSNIFRGKELQFEFEVVKD